MYEEFYYNFATVTIFDRQLGEDNLRFMAIGDGQQSAAFTASEKHFDMTFAYMFSFDDIVKNAQNAKKVLEKHFYETEIIPDKITDISPIVRNCVVVGRTPRYSKIFASLRT
ncbi:MAG: hypothetical protein IJR59_04820 [Firmicutes bacterium]|nr:hypothetical protein [Bacillota bacterium]